MGLLGFQSNTGFSLSVYMLKALPPYLTLKMSINRLSQPTARYFPSWLNDKSLVALSDLLEYALSVINSGNSIISTRESSDEVARY
jgi:hypothetical protein